jgi:selT/selW/selH-like putative selenoprotein
MLVRGSGGIFEVAADGRVIYSNRQTGRFPTPEEVLALLEPPP